MKNEMLLPGGAESRRVAHGGILGGCWHTGSLSADLSQCLSLGAVRGLPFKQYFSIRHKALCLSLFSQVLIGDKALPSDSKIKSPELGQFYGDAMDALSSSPKRNDLPSLCAASV